MTANRDSTALNGINSLRRQLEPVLTELEALQPGAGGAADFVFNLPNVLRDIDRYLGHIVQCIKDRPAPLQNSFTVEEAAQVVRVVERSQFSITQLQDCLSTFKNDPSFARLDADGSRLLPRLQSEKTELQALKDRIEREVQQARTAAAQQPRQEARQQQAPDYNFIIARLLSLLPTESKNQTSSIEPAKLVEEYGKGYKDGLAEGQRKGFEAGVEDTCKRLISLNIFASIDTEPTPLMRAVLRGSVDSIKLLRRLNVPFNQLSLRTASTGSESRRRSPLCVAIEQNDLAIVEELLTSGAEVHQHEPDGNNSLLSAASAGNDEILHLLIGKGVTSLLNVKHRTGPYRDLDPLSIAVLNGHDAVVETLFGQHTILHSPPAAYETPLHLACQKGHFKVVKYFLDQGVSANTTATSTGNSLLHTAVICDQVDIIQLLVSRGAGTEAENDEELTPLLLATDRASETGPDVACNIIEQLIGSGAKLEHDDRRYSAIVYAASRGQLEIVKLLLLLGADYSYVPNREFGMPALHSALDNGHIEVAQELLNAGARIDTASTYFQCPFERAIETGNKPALECLLRRPIYRNYLKQWSESKVGPLHLAITHGQRDLLDFLVKKGADVEFALSTSDVGNYRPLHHAADMLDYEAVEMLLKQEADPLQKTTSSSCLRCSSAQVARRRASGLYPRCFLEAHREEVCDDIKKKVALGSIEQLLKEKENGQGPDHNPATRSNIRTSRTYAGMRFR